MKQRFLFASLLLLGLPMFAHASCDEVKSSIDQKIKANNVAHYSLDVVSGDQADSNGGKVVGTCEGDKKIVYTKGGSDSSDTASPSKSSSKSDDTAPASSASSGG